jgi:uncharacterized membrane protein YgaE (UPF0421/DUF939 family)
VIVLDKLRDMIRKSPVGMRSLKTALAVVLAAALAKHAFHSTPFFACIGAAVAMESSLARSVKAAVIRNVGTFMGGAMGVLAGVFLKTTVEGNSVFLGLGVIPLIAIINLTRHPESIVPGCITYFATVFLNDSDGTLHYGIMRVMDTFLGTLVALAVNYLVFPPKAPEQAPQSPPGRS